IENVAHVSSDQDVFDDLTNPNRFNNTDDETVAVRDITMVVWAQCIADAPVLFFQVKKSGSLVDEPISFLWEPSTASTPPSVSGDGLGVGVTTYTHGPIAWPG